MPTLAVLTVILAWRLLDKYLPVAMADKAPKSKKANFNEMMNRLVFGGIKIPEKAVIADKTGETYSILYNEEKHWFTIVSKSLVTMRLDRSGLFRTWAFTQDMTGDKLSYCPVEIIGRWLMCELYKQVMPKSDDFDVSPIQKQFTFEVKEEV